MLVATLTGSALGHLVLQLGVSALSAKIASVSAQAVPSLFAGDRIARAESVLVLDVILEVVHPEAEVMQ